MTAEQQKEQFSIAYVRAIAATARVNIYKPEVDTDSIDIGFSVKSKAGQPQSPRIEAQLKCVTKLSGNDPLYYRYKLDSKNYDELIGDHYTPRILIVVLVPPSPADWIEQSQEKLSLFHCGYWVSLQELQPTENKDSVTINLPKAQVFSPDVLRRLLPNKSAL